MSKNSWKRISSKVIYENPWITLEEDHVINPGGGSGIYGKVLFKNVAIGILPIDEHMNTWLVGQWRYTLNQYSWEIPMGGGPRAADHLESAKRELREETGLLAHHWQEIMQIHTSNSVTNELGLVYLATDLEQGDSDLEETEDITVKKLPFQEALTMVMDGQITDSISVAAILRYARTLNL